MGKTFAEIASDARSELDRKLEQHDKGWEEAKENNAELGEGVHVGKVVTFPVADGRAAYEIVEVGDSVSRVKWREDLCLDGYHSDAVSNGRIFTDTLERACKRMDFRASLGP